MCSVWVIAFLFRNPNSRKHLSVKTKTRYYENKNTKTKTRKHESTMTTMRRRDDENAKVRWRRCEDENARTQSLKVDNYRLVWLRVFVFVLSCFRVLRLLKKNAMVLMEHRSYRWICCTRYIFVKTLICYLFVTFSSMINLNNPECLPYEIFLDTFWYDILLISQNKLNWIDKINWWQFVTSFIPVFAVEKDDFHCITIIII